MHRNNKKNNNLRLKVELVSIIVLKNRNNSRSHYLQIYQAGRLVAYYYRDLNSKNSNNIIILMLTI